MCVFHCVCVRERGGVRGALFGPLAGHDPRTNQEPRSGAHSHPSDVTRLSYAIMEIPTKRPKIELGLESLPWVALDTVATKLNDNDLIRDFHAFYGVVITNFRNFTFLRPF